MFNMFIYSGKGTAKSYIWLNWDIVVNFNNLVAKQLMILLYWDIGQ